MNASFTAAQGGAILVTIDGSQIAQASAASIRHNANPQCPDCHGVGTRGQLIVPNVGRVQVGGGQSVRIQRGMKPGPYLLCACTHYLGFGVEI